MRLFTFIAALMWLSAAAAQDAPAEYEAPEFRRSYVSSLLLNPGSPIDTSNVDALRFFPLDGSYAVQAIILPLRDTATVSFPTSAGTVKHYRPYAKLYFRLEGELRSLVAFAPLATRYNPLYADKLFVPFFDLSNGEGTYGGGRYLDVSRRAVDSGELIIDFNRAYNPWCAYGDGFSCPVPPPSNRLNVAVYAGEAAFVSTTAAAVH